MLDTIVCDCSTVRCRGLAMLRERSPMQKHMPPRVLINCVVTAAGCPPIMAEIQIYHAGIKKIADLQHRYYEIRRATALSELIAEADAARSKQEVDDDHDEIVAIVKVYHNL